MPHRAARPAIAIAVLALLPGLACAADPPGAAVAIEEDVVYRRVGGVELKADLARPPSGDGPFPALLVIHGGGWKGGDKKDVRPYLGRFAARGYVAVAPQYRFAPEHPFPAQVHDVKAAVRWLRREASSYRIDAGRVGAIGVSAGGHLALLLGVTGPGDGLDDDDAEGDLGSAVQAVVNYFGPSDLAADDFPPVVQGLLRDLLGGPPAERPAEAARASPLTFVTPGDPPILTFQGTKDPLVPYTQALKLAAKQTEAGVPGRVELLLGRGHGDDWGRELERTVGQAFAFFDAHLKPARP